MKTFLNSALAFAMAAGTASFNAYANIPPPLPITEKIEGTNSARCVAVLLMDERFEKDNNLRRSLASNHYQVKTSALLKDQANFIFRQVINEEMVPFVKQGGFTQNDARIWMKRVNDCIEGATAMSLTLYQ